MRHLKAFCALTALVLGAIAFSSCSNNNNSNPAAPVTVFQPVTVYSTFTLTPTGSATPTFTITLSPTSTWTPVTILVTATFTPTGSATSTPTITDSPTSTWTPVTIVITPTFTNTPCTGVLGYSGASTGSGFTSSGTMFLNRFQCAASGNLQSLSVNLQSGGTTFQLGIYTDDGAGNPVSLLGDTGPYPVSGSGWNKAPLPTSVPITSGNYYWLAFHTDATFIQETGSFPYQGDWAIGTSYSPFAAAFGGVVDKTSPIRYSLYGSVCP